MAALHERLKLWQRILLGIFCFPLLPFYLCFYCLCLKDDRKVEDIEENRQSSSLENGRKNQTRLSFINQGFQYHDGEHQQEALSTESSFQHHDGEHQQEAISTESSFQEDNKQSQKVKLNQDIDEDRTLQEKKKEKSKPAGKFSYPWDRSSLKSLQIDLKALEKLDQFASKLDTKGTAEQLVQALICDTNTELEKTRAIWIWICYHIEYDYEGYKNKALRYSDPKDVLRARKGVCAGYASLFQHMGSIAGLQCKEVRGLSKGQGYMIGQKISRNTNHAWNMICLNGRWHLLDSTWGAGVVDDSKFTYKYNEIYFLTHPAIFIMDHLPEDPDCQLLETCLSHQQFENNVYPDNHYYNFNMVSYHPQTCVIETVKGKASIAIESGCKMEFSFELNNTETPGILKLMDNGMNLDVYPKKTGQHILSIFARKENSDGDLKCIMKYRVDCSFVDTSMVIPKCLYNPVGPNWISQKAGLFNPSHPDPIIHTDDGCCTISFRTEKMTAISVRLKSDDIQNMPNHVILSLKKDKVKSMVHLPQAGSYALLLFDDITGYIGSYLIVCSNPNVKWPPFPSSLHNPVGPSSMIEKAGLLQPSHTDPIIHADDGCCTLSFRTERMLKITVNLRSDDIQTMPNHVILSVNKDKVELIVRLPQAGSYALLLFDDVTGYIGNYLIVCSNPNVKWSPFPSFLHNPVGPSSSTEKAGLLQPSQADPIIYAEDGTCTISFSLKKDVKIYCTLDSDEITLPIEMQNRHVLQTQKNDNLEIKVHLPRSGTYVLQIFIKPRESTSCTYSYLCNYLITCSNPSVKLPMFPLAYKGWKEHFELVCPLEGVLPKNSNIFFRLKITDIAAVCADGKMSIPLTLTDSGYWEGTSSTEGVKELFVTIKYNKESDISYYILKYTIEGY
ncbi:kyphoscoliosis peptidase-like [Dendrobates tinctorius]|uniref:kyphoscoliosis peptidase-like n=1 Tax=Dendrobates tinctorius TaxID=92724 RepID=UPI003CC9BCA5